ncbi:MAG: hypothetical protein JSV09_14420 [Thermoplasmata archaeon]|nr:MAG: hypothetical protein JSV09_14420 [Thermoplasmata archaeon]
MLSYPISIFGYFIVGTLGAITFLFLLLLFDKDIAILKNDYLGLIPMAYLYVILGGILSVVVNMASSPDFTVNQLMVAFVTGIGWPAIAAGIGSGKRVGELNKEKNDLDKEKDKLNNEKNELNEIKQKISRLNTSFEDMTDGKIEEVRKHFQGRLEKSIKNYEMAIARAEKEVEEVHTFYKEKLSSIGSG